MRRATDAIRALTIETLQFPRLILALGLKTLASTHQQRLPSPSTHDRKILPRLVAMDCSSPELSKLPVSYTTGSIFTHISSRTHPNSRKCCHYFRSGRKEQSQLSPVERCPKKPPLEGTTGSDSANIRILDLLEVGDGR